MALKTSDIQIPDLPRRTVEVTEFGGEVIVQGLLMTDWLNLYKECVLEDGTVDRGFYALALLHHCVVQDDGTPLLSVEEWNRLGRKHSAVMRLAGICREVVGDDEEAVEGNSPGPESGSD